MTRNRQQIFPLRPFATLGRRILRDKLYRRYVCRAHRPSPFGSSGSIKDTRFSRGRRIGTKPFPRPRKGPNTGHFSATVIARFLADRRAIVKLSYTCRAFLPASAQRPWKAARDRARFQREFWVARVFPASPPGSVPFFRRSAGTRASLRPRVCDPGCHSKVVIK